MTHKQKQFALYLLLSLARIKLQQKSLWHEANAAWAVVSRCKEINKQQRTLLCFGKACNILERTERRKTEKIQRDELRKIPAKQRLITSWPSERYLLLFVVWLLFACTANGVNL